ncbi:MAG: DUF502 domain-containing protein [Thermodesulfobacteriota bacterium]|nr:DUF502 domain-containing protein [Thermodesulfobacteriota bacterium]
MKIFVSHLKKHIFRGLVAIIPLALTYFAIMFLYSTIDQRIVGIIRNIFGFSFPGLGIFLLLILLYILGIIVSNVVGKQIFKLLEKITDRIPLIRTTYKVGQQLGVTLSLPEKNIFKKAVLVEYLKPGIWTVGFITGIIIDRSSNNEKLFKVFVPTPPNPTSGTMVIVREAETRDPGWSIEEALYAILSAGIIGPEELR